MSKKVALVTGASSGIGAAVTLQLAECGYEILAAGRDAERTASLCDKSDNIRTWVGDLSSADACTELVATCTAAFGRLDLLVNNAGIYETANAEKTSDDLWSRTLAINLHAPFYLSRAAIPHFARNTRRHSEYRI